MSEKHILVTGATCKCMYGKTPDQLVLLTNTVVHANDTYGPPKFMASTMDIGRPFLLNSFGPCIKLYNMPCTVMVTGWLDFKERITLPNLGHPLMEDSRATCSFGSLGCISVVHHGQVSELSTQNFQSGNPDVHLILNPALDINEMDDDPAKPEGINIS